MLYCVQELCTVICRHELFLQLTVGLGLIFVLFWCFLTKTSLFVL